MKNTKSTSINDSMLSSTASQRSKTPNTTNKIQAKPAFTPPPQKNTKKDS